MIPFCPAVGGIEITVGGENKVFAVAAESCSVSIIPCVCHGSFGARGELKEEYA